MPWAPSGIVTLLTDFGVSDPYVGVMKGVLHREAPELRSVIDLSHDVPPQNIELAAFFLASSIPYFPAGTVHAVVVDPEVGTERALLLAEVDGQLVVGPDNGVIAPAVEAGAQVRVRRADPERTPVIGTSRTFHGRDRIAPLSARIAAGADPAGFGPVTEEWRRLELPPAETRDDGSLNAVVVAIDRFGNLITNVRAAQLDGGGRWECVLGPRHIPLVRTYAEVEPEALCALIDSFDRLEIAVRNGNAAHELRLSPGAEIRVVPMQAGAGR